MTSFFWVELETKRRKTKIYFFSANFCFLAAFQERGSGGLSSGSRSTEGVDAAPVPVAFSWDEDSGRPLSPSPVPPLAFSDVAAAVWHGRWGGARTDCTSQL